MSGFTVKALAWSPYLPPLQMQDATEEQLRAMQVTPSGGKVSPYVRTLAHDPQSYEARTRLYNEIMYAKGGIDQEWRELGSLIASVVNGCTYCASVHARRYIQITNDSDLIQQLYLNGLDGTFDPRIAAVIAFSRALSVTPAAATPAHVQALRDQGFTKDEIFDLIHAVSIFGWANRLMHVLGEPKPAGTKIDV